MLKILEQPFLQHFMDCAFRQFSPRNFATEAAELLVRVFVG